MYSKLLFTFLFITSTSLCGQTWSLVWQDEFNNSSLDTSKWMHEIGTGSQYGLWGWGNSEQQYYQPSNTEVYNGTMKIIAKEEPNGITDSWGNTKYYSSSRITTKNKHDFKYGKIQARIKTVDGEGFWPAFWMLPTNGSWPCDGEIDIMEQWVMMEIQIQRLVLRTSEIVRIHHLLIFITVSSIILIAVLMLITFMCMR